MKLEWLLILANSVCLILILTAAIDVSFISATHVSSLLFSLNSLLCSFAYFEDKYSVRVKLLFMLGSVVFTVIGGYLLSQVVNVPGRVLPLSISSFIISCIMGVFVLFAPLTSKANVS